MAKSEKSKGVKKYEFKTSEGEYEKISEAIRQGGGKKYLVAGQIGCNPSQFSEFIKGVRYMTPAVATKLYNALGKPDSLKFLITYQTKPPKKRSQPVGKKSGYQKLTARVLADNARMKTSTEEETHWNALFNLRTNQLKEGYTNSSIMEKARILDGLSVLVEE